jgi:hypothetical protein
MRSCKSESATEINQFTGPRFCVIYKILAS